MYTAKGRKEGEEGKRERVGRKEGSRKEIKASKNNKTYIIPALKTNKLKLTLSAPSSYQLST